MNVLPHPALPIEIGLTAAIVAVADDEPMILVARAGSAISEAALPAGPFASCPLNCKN